jgi:5-phospho-D-xylono-1,4-lactonase
MTYIRTVKGDISPSELGICHPHEHLIGAPPAIYAETDLTLDDEDAALESLRTLKSTGVGALVEMTPIDYHRDPAALARIAAQTDVHVIAVTGYLKAKFSQPLVASQSVDDLTQRFIHEIEHGMDDTQSRAGVIKAASSMNTITESEHKVFVAAAQAHQATGALISTHTEAGTMGIEQVELLTGLGVPPNRILIGHLDHCLDIDYHREIADSGVYMGIDQIGKTKYAPDADRITAIRQLIDAGHAEQLMLSMDIARRSYLPAYGGKPGFTYLLEEFVPMLSAAGVPAATIDVIIKDNPARALTRAF